MTTLPPGYRFYYWGKFILVKLTRTMDLRTFIRMHQFISRFFLKLGAKMHAWRISCSCYYYCQTLLNVKIAWHRSLKVRAVPLNTLMNILHNKIEGSDR